MVMVLRFDICTIKLMMYSAFQISLWNMKRDVERSLMGRQIDSAIARFSQCSMYGVAKVVVCTILSVGWCIYIAVKRKE